MSSSTLQAFIVSRLQELVEILPSRKVKPMKVYLLHLVSLHTQLILIIAT